MKENPKQRKERLLSLIRPPTDPILKRVCDEVKRDDDLSWLYTLRSVCLESDNGVGMAAPQIGIAKRGIVVMPNRNLVSFMINPVIVWKGPETQTGIEGCLSFPGVYKNIFRHTMIDVEYFNEKWQKKASTFGGFEAVVVQHECDHLDGICAVGQP